MGVEADYRDITERLKPEREKLQRSLDAIDTELRGPNSKMWRMELIDVFSQRYRDEERRYTWNVPRYHAHLWAEGWSASVGAIVPHTLAPDFAGDWKVESFVEVDYPPALDARREFSRVLPQIDQYTTDQDVDVDELILLPEKLGEFHSGWKAVANTLTSLPTDIRRISRLQGDRWTGEGAEQHGYVIEDMTGAANATITGITNAMSNVLYISETGVAIASALLDVATKMGNDAADWVDMIVGIDPSRWWRAIGRIAKKAAQINEEHNETVKAGLQEVLNSADWNNSVDQQFIELRTALGGEIVWPRADPGLAGRWGRS